MQNINVRIDTQAHTRKRAKPPLAHFFKKQINKSLGHLCVFWQILFFYLPLSVLVIRGAVGVFSSTNKSIVSSFFTLEYAHILLNSLFLSLTTTLVTLALGLCIAYTLAFHVKRFKKLLLLLIIIPFWTNFALHMYSWFYILQPDGPLNTLLINLHIISTPLNLTSSSFSVYLMMCYFYLPFMLICIYSSFQRFDYSLIEASKNLGAKASSTFFKILLPLNMKGIRTGIFLVLIPSFGEFIIPEMMGGDTTSYIGNVITLFALGDKTQLEGIILTFFSLVVILTIAHLINIALKKVSRLISRRSYR
jgi:spermidine/putrescine transport system permease protein